MIGQKKKVSFHVLGVGNISMVETLFQIAMRLFQAVRAIRAAGKCATGVSYFMMDPTRCVCF